MTFKEKLIQNFIEEERYKMIFKGLGTTLLITLFAVLLGILLGFLVATIRSTYSKTGKLFILDRICWIYITVIRGTPMIVQLLIMYYVIFASYNSKVVRRLCEVELCPLMQGSLRRGEALAFPMLPQ